MMCDGKVFKFLDAQIEAEKEGKHEFVCPICGNKAFWERSSSNGHLHVACTYCDMVLHE